MTAERDGTPHWPPVAVLARLRELFQGPITGLAERAVDYQTGADDPDLETWELFTTEMRSSLSILKAACPVHDASAIRGRGHSLEGMGGMVGLPDLSVIGAELSQAARGEDWERCTLLTQRLGLWVTTLAPAAAESDDDDESESDNDNESESDSDDGSETEAEVQAEVAAAAGAPLDPRRPAPALVLIADDNPVYLAKLRGPLAARGYRLLEATNGAMALHLAQHHLPSLALLDVEMPPGLTGYEVCERLKAAPETHETAVIMVTARRGSEDVVRGLNAGAFDYIRKPFHPRELLARVRNALALKQTTDDLKQTTEALQLWKQKMQHEIEVAAALQHKLFPVVATHGPGYEVHRTYRPSSTQIGGDLFDAFPLPDGRLCAYMGDVAGHNVAPAIVSALLKMIIIEVAAALGAAGPAAVCREVQRRFRSHVPNPELYATLFLAFLDTQRGTWTCMNCGHPDPILLQADGTNAWPLVAGRGDLPIGFWFGAPEDYAVDAEVSVPAVPGSTLWLITDGLFEARHRETGEPCGPERLLDLVRRTQADAHSVSPAERLLTALDEDGFTLDTDDCSAMAVECVDPRSVRLDCQAPLDLSALSALAADIERILQAEGWAEVPCSLARLVAMEHLANVFKHGRAPAHSAVSAQLRLTGSVCRLWFTDRGREWDFPSRPKAISEDSLTSEHGRGLALIQACSAHAEYSRRDDQNHAFFALERDPVSAESCR
jgi:sigma-B regulation protein RsbU (phosphoserine phosphatase)